MCPLAVPSSDPLKFIPSASAAAGSSAIPADADAALWKLARRLYDEMERLDPDDTSWDDLTELDREMWYFSVRAMLSERAEVLRVLHVDVSNNNNIGRRCDL